MGTTDILFLVVFWVHIPMLMVTAVQTQLQQSCFFTQILTVSDGKVDKENYNSILNRK